LRRLKVKGGKENESISPISREGEKSIMHFVPAPKKRESKSERGLEQNLRPIGR